MNTKTRKGRLIVERYTYLIHYVVTFPEPEPHGRQEHHSVQLPFEARLDGDKTAINIIGFQEALAEKLGPDGLLIGSRTVVEVLGWQLVQRLEIPVDRFPRAVPEQESAPAETLPEAVQ